MRTAFRAFAAALFDKTVSEKIDAVLSGDDVQPAALPSPQPRLEPSAASAPAPAPPARSEAITLLATLQRESRLVDLVYEDLTNFGDAQVGAAARPCLQQCQKTLQRVLDIRPIETAGEGQTVNIGDQPSPTRYQRVGDGQSATPRLVHHGWMAGQVSLPEWTGNDDDADVIAPAQVEG
ncbi:DUF2760 domain-containing protein [Crateriforma conspicua]|nr:DUF2760 domain-containing protein [Crateriforma conspicua]